MNDSSKLCEHKLLKMSTEFDKHFWVGEQPPLDFVSANIQGCTNYRLSSSHHSKYEVVWLYEVDLACIPSGKYELILDEVLRLIGEKGKLVVRYSQSKNFSVIGLKSFLGRKYNFKVSVSDEWHINGFFTTVFDVDRVDVQRYRKDDWTFAILTQGARLDNVIDFLKSVRTQGDHEIIVCGPEDKAYKPFGVRYHSQADGHLRYRENLAEISRKKNDIASIATRTNLMIVHDRYKLNEDFFSGFEQFGYDFDFASCLQWYQCGTRFPAYAAMERPGLSWSPPVDCDDYSTLQPNQFLNGGLLIAKSDTLRDIRFNDMLFWNQAEDLELSTRFRLQGIPPRMNVFSSATTLGIDPSYTSAFRPLGSRSLRVPKGNIGERLKGSGREIERRLRPYFRKAFRKAA